MIRKTMVGFVAAVALVVPLAALADNATPAPSTVASDICKQEQASLGAAAFTKLYGTNASQANAFGKCVAKNASASQQDVANAAKSCASSKSAHGNAFGKCVSAAVKQAETNTVAATVSAAKSCKADQKADAAAFAAKYGTGRNAFGKCVAAKSTTK